MSRDKVMEDIETMSRHSRELEEKLHYRWRFALRGNVAFARATVSQVLKPIVAQLIQAEADAHGWSVEEVLCCHWDGCGDLDFDYYEKLNRWERALEVLGAACGQYSEDNFPEVAEDEKEFFACIEPWLEDLNESDKGKFMRAVQCALDLDGKTVRILVEEVAESAGWRHWLDSYSDESTEES